MNSFMLMVLAVLGCAACAAGGALGLRAIVPTDRGSRARAEDRAPRWEWIRSAVLLAAIFPVGIAIGGLANWSDLRAADERTWRAIAVVTHDYLERMSAAVTEIGDITATGFIAVLIGVVLGYQQRSIRLLAVPIVAYWLALQAQRTIDRFDGRPRPDSELVIGPAGGYPSGGTIRVVLVVGLLAVVLAQFWTRRSEVLVIGAGWGLLSGVEIVSRAVLARHWPIDLLGGLVIGVMLLAAVAPALRLRVAKSPPASRPATADQPVDERAEAAHGVRA